MRYFLLAYVLITVAIVSIAGCRGTHFRKPPIFIFPDMKRQAKLRPQTDNVTLPGHLSSQLPVAGTIARGTPWQDTPINTGRVPGSTNVVETIPIPVTMGLLERGQQRFQINCSPCHGSAGDGKGITTKFGMAIIRNLQDPLIVAKPDGDLFSVITYGRGLMGPYGANVEVNDRWAIIAYLRALQRSRLAGIEDVRAGERVQIPSAPPVAPPAEAKK